MMSGTPWRYPILGLVVLLGVLAFGVSPVAAQAAETPAPADALFGYAPHPPATGDIISFHDRSTGDIDRWAYDFGDGSSSTEQYPDHKFDAAGTYAVSLEVCNEAGCGRTTTAIQVTDGLTRSPNRIAAFTFTPEQPRAGEPVTFADQSSADGIASLWRIADIGSYSSDPTAQSHTVIFDQPGSYTAIHLNCWTSPRLECDRQEMELVVTAANPATGAAPTDVRYDGFYGHPTVLTWTDTNSAELGYRVHAASPDLPALDGPRGDFPPNTTTVQFTEFQAAYFVVCYTVRPILSGDVEGPASDAVCSQADAAPVGTPVGLVAERESGADSVTVSWNSEVSGTFQFWVCADGGSAPVIVNVSRDDFLWEVVDGASVTRGYELVFVVPDEPGVVVSVHADVINQNGPCSNPAAPSVPVSTAPAPSEPAPDPR